VLNNLIFLGQIPGTNFFITFSDITDFLALVLAAVLCYELNRLEQSPWGNLSIDNLRNQYFIMPEQATGHTSSTLPANDHPVQLDFFAF
jgi:hypothetical protein